MTEFDRNIATFKENLPAKCIKGSYPQILWVQAPLHDSFLDNSLRFKFNKCLEELSRLHSNCHTLFLKRVWDPQNLNLVQLQGGTIRYTAEGYSTYWEAVDCTVHYFDSVLLKKQDKFGKKLKNGDPVQKDRFRWQNPAYNKDLPEDFRGFRSLPPPP